MSYEDIIFSGFNFVLLQSVLQEADIMNLGKTAFAQIMSLIPGYEFDKCVKRNNGNRYVIGFKCRDLFLIMNFAQFTDKVSLCGIDVTQGSTLFQTIFARNKVIQRSTLAHINETKNWRIYHDFRLILIVWERKLYQSEPSRLDMDGIVHAFCGSTIKLNLQFSLWVRLHHDKGAVNMHTLLDLRDSIPIFIYLTEAAVRYFTAMNLIPTVSYNHYLMDKYIYFMQLFNHFHRQQVSFVTIAKNNIKYEVIEDHLVDRQAGVICNSVIKHTGLKTSKWYPDTLRIVAYDNYATGNVYRFVTNDSTHSYLTIAELYGERR
ncbi:uncharacterized protein DUF4372 [Hallella colorans]|uniref:Uncharacterized protein DUF4372 n=2 Tax=Hallella colorans TaxID=1703337 RepID=A0A2U0UP56_9BACT|nr:uncharacterized protein DUF4372 [Hallella colorans]